MTANSSPKVSEAQEAMVSPPIDKQRRYDRGIRVWGAHGQDALERACICLLNCGPTGSEALKNLVLGGIRSFTVVDGHRVAPSDLGNNYLVTAASLGGSRAESVTGAPCLACAHPRYTAPACHHATYLYEGNALRQPECLGYICQ